MKDAMQDFPKLPGYFKNEGPDLIRFHSANALKSSFLQGVIFFSILAFTMQAIEFISSRKIIPLYWIPSNGDDIIGLIMLRIFPFLCFFLWLVTKPTQVFLDRAAGTASYKWYRTAFTLPWHQISFSHQYFPTKSGVGGSTLFTLVARAPFPEPLQRKIDKKKAKSGGREIIYKLGSFDVKNAEHGTFIFEFLDAWMHSDLPAEALFDAMVRSRSGG